MNRRKLSLSEIAAYTAETLPKGILLTSGADGKANSMVIGWGTVGVNWNLPVFAAYVRVSRFTRELLDQKPEFTVNIPLEPADRNTIAICGGKSGRDLDKLAACGLHTVPGETVSVPAILEYPVTVECRILYRQQEDISLLPEEIRSRFYPHSRDDAPSDNSRDPHVTYYGQILSAYVLEPGEGES